MRRADDSQVLIELDGVAYPFVQRARRTCGFES
jgi:hypothetical protein